MKLYSIIMEYGGQVNTFYPYTASIWTTRELADAEITRLHSIYPKRNILLYENELNKPYKVAEK